MHAFIFFHFLFFQKRWRYFGCACTCTCKDIISILLMSVMRKCSFLMWDDRYNIIMVTIDYILNRPQEKNDVWYFPFLLLKIFKHKLWEKDKGNIVSIFSNKVFNSIDKVNMYHHYDYDRLYIKPSLRKWRHLIFSISVVEDI